MIGFASLKTILIEDYRLEPACIDLMIPDRGGRLVYKVMTGVGDLWIARLFRQDAPLLSWIDGKGGAAWLGERVAVLEWFRTLGYPAPRTLRRRDGALTGSYEGWSLSVTEYLPGETAPRNAQARGEIAGLLRKLHSIGVESSASEREALPYSWWAPIDRAAVHALRLFSSLSAIPVEWQPLVEACQAILMDTHYLRELSETAIHGDPWTGNAIIQPGNRYTLIDWENAGRGPALLDLGCLLSDCFDVAGEELELDPASVEAVVGGYLSCRSLPAEEVNALPYAIRYGAAFRTALRCKMAEQAGWEGAARRGLLREQARIQNSERIASQVRVNC